MPHSLGLLYERMTTHLGFLHSSDEYKVMALASYGEPVFVGAFRDMIHLSGKGMYTIDDVDFARLFGPRRKKGAPFGAHQFDIAHSLQKVLQETVLQITEWLRDVTDEDALCIAGGVGLNCVMNAWLRDKGPFRNIWVQLPVCLHAVRRFLAAPFLLHCPLKPV